MEQEEGREDKGESEEMEFVRAAKNYRVMSLMVWTEEKKREQR